MTDRELLTPVAVLVVSLILLATTATLMVAGWHTLAALVALVGLPVSVFGVASTVRVFFRLLERMAELREQKRQAETDRGEP